MANSSLCENRWPDLPFSLLATWGPGTDTKKFLFQKFCQQYGEGLDCKTATPLIV
jgi:hypothetical protein